MFLGIWTPPFSPGITLAPSYCWLIRYLLSIPKLLNIPKISLELDLALKSFKAIKERHLSKGATKFPEIFFGIWTPVSFWFSIFFALLKKTEGVLK